MTHIYHERQLGGLCGVHCLNNLLQGPHFGPGDLAEIGVQLDREEGALLAPATPTGEGQGSAGEEGTTEQQPYNVDPTADGGNFSIQVLCRALRRFSLELLPAKHPSAKDLMKDPPNAAEAFLCQYRDHWFAVRQVAGCWWNCNSTRKKPAMVGPFYLAAWLTQLDAEGYSIFLVVGGRLPEPAKPQDETKPEENFHEIYDLLEQGKQSGGNPLMGDGDDEQPVIPPDLEAMTMDPTLLGDGDPASMQAILAALEEDRCASSSSRGPYSGLQGSAADLLSMGYREAQIRCAQELAQGRGLSPAEILLRSRGVDVSIEGDGERLAEAIQESVFGLDNEANIDIAHKILYLVSLLSLERERLQAAAPHTNAEVLAEVLVSVMARRRTSWTPQCVKACGIAVDLMSSFPRSAVMTARARSLSHDITDEMRGPDQCDGSCGNACVLL